MLARYPDYEYALAGTQLVLVMFGMGATLSVGDFARVFRQPASLLVGFAAMFVAAPALAAAMVFCLPLPPGIGFGLILVATMPGGSLSNLFTYLGRGNVPLSIAMTAAATVGSIVYVPAALAILGSELPGEFQMPAGMILREVLAYLFLPLGAGMLLARFAPRRAEPLARWCVRGGLCILAIIVVGSLGSGRVRPADFGWEVPLAIILYCVLCQQLAMTPFRLLGWPTPDRFAVGIEITIRNVNLALLLAALLFPARATLADPVADGVLFVVLYYGAVSLIASIPPILVHRRIARRVARMERRGGNERQAALEAEVPEVRG